MAAPWLRIQRLIRSILEMRRDEITRPVMKSALTKALAEREREKQDLERRLAFVERDLEKARAKNPRGISTS